MTIEYTRRADGTIDLARLAGTLSYDLNAVRERITACASHLAYMREILPARGELTDEFEALVRHIAWIHDAHCSADEHLVGAAFLIDHEARVPHPMPLNAEVATTTQSSKMQATRSDASTSAIGNPEMRATA